jgi:transketolase
MAAIMNGLALYGGIIPFGGTFLTFSDYARNALRLAAIMQQKVIFVFTHDSIGLGEDGPTHQPIEHLPSLRLIPNLSIWRPCDTLETAVAWQMALERSGPTCLLLSRQTLPYQVRTAPQLSTIQQGGYILYGDEKIEPQAILIATGSEVCLAMEASLDLEKEGFHIRVVSMPSVDVFLAQEKSYQNKVLPGAVEARVAIEAAATNGWQKLVGAHGKIIGIDEFGASAPAKEVYADKKITVANIVATVKAFVFTSCSEPHHFQPKSISGLTTHLGEMK